MPVVPKKVAVIKIPRGEKAVSPLEKKVQPEFERMPRMYLELLENKEKIKPNLVNREYDPDEAESVYSFDMNRNAGGARQDEFERMNTIEEDDSDEDDPDASSGEDEEDNQSGVSERQNERFASSASEPESDEDTGDEEESIGSRSSAASSFSRTSFVPDVEKDRVGRDGYSTDTSTRSSSPGSAGSRSEGSRNRVRLPPGDEIIKNKTKEKLRNLLFSEEGQKDVPTLAELKKRGEVKEHKVIADLGRGDLGQVEEEDELKRELLFKFDLLKKSYKNISIPEFSMHSDYKNMNQTYENTLRQVSLDSNVESYKSLLVGGFMLLEFILGFWMKFDMSGFTQQQILNMNQYERLLIELGEKSYVPGGSQWPVELRLLGLIVMNAIIFIISKMIMKKTGSNLVGLMNSVNTMMPPINQKPKRRMRGPTVDLDSIPDVGEEE